MLSHSRRSLVKEIVAPSRARLQRTVQLTLLAMIVVVISMTFQIPDAALSSYILFFVLKEDSSRSILISIVFIVAITAVIGVVFLLAPFTLDHPGLRIPVIAAMSFALFFLGRTSKLAPLAGVLGLVIASTINLEQNVPFGEIETRELLFALLFILFPILTVIAFSVLFGRHPERLLRAALAERLNAAAALIRDDGERDRKRIRAIIAAGNVEALTELKMIGLFHRLPKDTAARLKALVTITYGLVLTAYALRRSGMELPDREMHLGRLDRLSDAIRHLPSEIPPSDADADQPEQSSDLPQRLGDYAAMIAAILAGGKVPGVGAPAARPAKSGFFNPDAFSNPDGERFAAKATAAVMICYLTFNILDWSNISTCMVTCFVVALSTVGESTQKMVLRLAGCTFGAALGYAMIVFLLPGTTQITGLLVLVGVITFPAAWIATGSPRVSYMGFQIAYAAYLCVLQGTEPKFDLTVARDRFVGIVFGNLVMYVVFTQVYVTSLLPGLSKDLVAILERCRSVLKVSSGANLALEGSEEVASVYALVGKIDAELIAYGFERRATRHARLHALSCRLIESALHDVVADVALVAALASADEGGSAQELRSRREAVDRRLAGLAEALATRGPIPAAANGAMRTGVFGTLHRHLDGLSAVTLRYRRILRKEADGSYA